MALFGRNGSTVTRLFSMLLLGACLLSVAAASRSQQIFLEDYPSLSPFHPVLPPVPDFKLEADDSILDYYGPLPPWIPTESVLIQASQIGAVPLVYVECTCSNGTTTPRSFLDPKNSVRIIGAGATTWTCFFTWSADQHIRTQEFKVYGPPDTWKRWTVDMDGFNVYNDILQNYQHVYNWVTG